MGSLYPVVLMTILMLSQGAIVVKFEFWRYAGEIYPNLSGNDPNGDFKGINGSSENDSIDNIYPAPGKGIYNDQNDRYIQVNGETLGSLFTVS